MENRKQHWENVFETKGPKEVSWFQEYPKTSIDYLLGLNLPKTANIIDIGGGDSNLVDALLEKGYKNLWVLDISAAALEKTKKRLGEKAKGVNWIVSDIITFESHVKFDFWHDRAAFHFLTDELSISKYISIVEKAIKQHGDFLLGTFSEDGPLKCSGLEIKKYSEEDMKSTFSHSFAAISCYTENHLTPFNTIQNFRFCGFKRK